MEVYAFFLPLCLCEDNAIQFGIQLTGTSGHSLLDGKYFTTIFEKEYRNKEIKYKNYCEEHIYKFEKIYHALEEGILLEMDNLDSIEKLYYQLRGENTTFFGSKYSGLSRGNDLHNYVCGLYECLYGDFIKGVNIFETIIRYDNYLCDKTKELDLENKEKFVSRYSELCNKGREFFKLVRQSKI